MCKYSKKMFIKYSFDNFHVLKFIKIVILMKDVNWKDEIYKDESKIGKCLAEKDIRILIGAGKKRRQRKTKRKLIMYTKQGRNLEQIDRAVYVVPSICHTTQIDKERSVWSAKEVVVIVKWHVFSWVINFASLSNWAESDRMTTEEGNFLLGWS